jgi:hypothetical protein
MSRIWESGAKAQIASAPQAVVYDAAAAMEFFRSTSGGWIVDTGGKEAYGDAHANSSTVKTIAAGSTVMETYLAGSPYEMTVMYHMDGPDKLLMDHFCAARNVPHAEFVKTDKPGEIKFEFKGGTNLNPLVDNHGHGATIKIIDKDSFVTTATTYSDGKPTTLVTKYKRAPQTASLSQ